MEKDGQLQLYILQLQQVNEALKQTSDAASKKDLEQLRDDLIELIALTEDGEECFETDQSSSQVIKKEERIEEADNGSCSRHLEDELSSFYKDICEMENDTTSEQNQAYERPTSPVAESSKLHANSEKAIAVPLANMSQDTTMKTEHERLNDQFLDSIEALDDISGVKCRAPFFTEWMGTQYHNAMIKGLLDKDSDTPDISVSVFFLNPTVKAMKPCCFYLDGNCRFQGDACQYSHGYATDLYSLRPFLTPDYSQLVEGSKCLVKMEDGLWKPAIVDKLENTLYHIKCLHKDLCMVLSVEDLLPQCTHDEETESEDVITELTPTQSAYSTSTTNEQGGNGSQQSIGVWEQHTKGIGMKLIQKMGYKPGEGLGKNNQGRIQPVPIVILPAGKSLDYCMTIKENKSDRVTSCIKRPPSKRKQANVFSFLNKALGKKDEKRRETVKPQDMFGINMDESKRMISNYSKEMFKNDEEMKKIAAKVSKVRKSIQRNSGNASITDRLRRELNALETKLKEMKSHNAAIKMHKSRMETHKKMAVF